VLTENNDAKIRLRDTFRKVFPPTEREKSINDGYIPMNREEENPSPAPLPWKEKGRHSEGCSIYIACGI
jgi:hypothetical protein